MHDLGADALCLELIRRSLPLCDIPHAKHNGDTEFAKLPRRLETDAAIGTGNKRHLAILLFHDRVS